MAELSAELVLYSLTTASIYDQTLIPLACLLGCCQRSVMLNVNAGVMYLLLARAGLTTAHFILQGIYYFAAQCPDKILLEKSDSSKGQA